MPLITQKTLFSAESLKLFAVYMLVYFAIYALSFQSQVIAYDEAMDFNGTAYDVYTTNGRWFHAVYRYILGEGTTVWASAMLTGVFLSASSVVQVRLFALKHWLEKSLCMICTLSCGAVPNMIGFNHHVDAYACAIFLVTLAAHLLITNFKYSIIVASFFVAFAVGSYQSSVFYFLTLILIFFLLKCIEPEGKIQIRLIFAALVTLLLGFVLSFSASAIAALGADDYVRSYSEFYLGSFSQMGSITSLDATSLFFYVATYTLRAIRYACGYGYEGQLLYISSTFAAAGIIISATRRFVLLRAASITTLTLLIWILPFCIIIPLGNDPAVRVFMSEGLSVCFLWIICLQLYRGTRTGFVLSCAITIFAAIAALRAGFIISKDEATAIRLQDITHREWSEMELLRQELSRQQGKELSMIVVPVAHPKTLLQGEINSYVINPRFMYLFMPHMHGIPASYGELDSRKSPLLRNAQAADALAAVSSKEVTDTVHSLTFWPDLSSYKQLGDVIIVKMRDAQAWRQDRFNLSK